MIYTQTLLQALPIRRGSISSWPTSRCPTSRKLSCAAAFGKKTTKQLQALIPKTALSTI